MIRFQALPVDLPGATGHPSVPRTAAGRAIGGIDGWRMFLEPGRAWETGAEERVSGAEMALFGGALAFGTLNGQRAMNYGDVQTSANRIRGGFAVNPGAWTFFAVIRTSEATSGGQRLIGPEVQNPEGVGLNITVRSGNEFSLLTGGSTVRVEDAESIQNNVPILMMMSFSLRDGLRVFANGVQTAAAANDRTPLGAYLQPGDLSIYRNMRGMAAECGLFDIDLGWPEHSGFRRAIENYLGPKYGLPILHGDSSAGQSGGGNLTPTGGVTPS